MSVVEEIRNDPEKGVKRLEYEYKAGLLAVARRLCPDLTDAEALVYRTFSEVVAKIDGYSEQSAFFGWMCKILVNCHAKDVRRKSNSTVFYTDEVPDAVGDDAKSVEEAVDAGILREAIENLPPEMKEAVILRYFMDQPVLKIAQVLSLPVGTVKSRLYYARVLLGKRLGANLKKRAVAVAAIAALLLAASAATVAIVLGDVESREARHSRSTSPSGLAAPSSQSIQESNQEGESEMNATTAMKSAMFAAALGATATATGATWTNGLWSVAENWAEGVVPDAGAAVTISPPVAGMTLTIDVESVSVGNLTFSGKSVTITGGAITMSGSMTANVAATINNDITTTATWPYLYCSGKVTMYGDFTGKSGSTVTMGTTSGGSNGGADFRGGVTIPNGTIVFDKPGWKSPPFNFYGPVKVSTIKSSNYNNTTALFCSTGNEWTSLQNGYAKGHPNCEGALPATSTVKLLGTTYEINPFLNLRNYSQTIDRILSDELTNTSGTTEKGKAMTYSLRSYRSSASDAASTTLKLNATANNQNHVRVYDKVTLIYNPTGAFTQTFATNFAHTTSGDIMVSNGTFRVAGTSSFANVKRIVVADGATFALLTEAANALAGVTNIVLGAGSHFAITNATTPFAANAVTLEMDETSTFDLPEDANYLFAAVSVDGEPIDGDTYTGGGAVPQFSGAGSITVPDVEQPTVNATWTGEGGTDGIAVSANWGGTTPALTAKSLYPLFASGGAQATVDRALDFKGLHFGGSASSFSLVSNTPSASLTLRQSGIAVDASHTATVDVPVTIKADQAWSVASGSTLRFKSPVGMASPYAVAVSGAGTLRLDAENGFLGGFSAAGGLAVDVYSPTNAFGPAGDNAVTVNGKLFLHGAHIERPVTVTGQNNQYYWFGVYGTNEMTKAFTHASDAYWRPRLYANSRLVCSGGVTVCCDVILTGESGSCWVIKDKPWKHSNLSSSVSQLELDSGATMRFGASGCVVKILMMKSSGRLYCDIDNPFSGRATELQFHGANSMIDLNGHVATFGNVTRLSGGTVTSETPGTLVLSAQSGTITNKAVRFTGAAGFEMAGTGAVFFNSEMESTASLSVSRGRLGFTENGSWRNATNVTVSGTGRLVVAKAKTFSSDAAMAIADSGVVEIPSGVVLRVASLTVDGAPVPKGSYGSSESPADKTYAGHFAGAGSLAVGKAGFMIIVE